MYMKINGFTWSNLHKIGIIVFFAIVFILITQIASAKPVTYETNKHRDPNSSDKRDSRHWKFSGDGKKSPIPGITWRKSGYQCFVVTPAGVKKTIESNTSTNVGKMTKAADKALGIKTTRGRLVKNVGKNIPVFKVGESYEMTCYIWINGKVLNRKL